MIGDEIKAAREAMAMSQSQFATAFRLNVATLRDWEQGRRKLDIATQTWLAIICRDPQRALALIRETFPE